MSQVIDKDRGWNDIKRMVEELRGQYTVDVGANPKPFEEAGVAYYPAILQATDWPFITWTLDAHDNYRVEQRRMVASVVDACRKGATPRREIRKQLRAFGENVCAGIRDMITALGLIDTARMLRSIKVLRVTRLNQDGHE